MKQVDSDGDTDFDAAETYVYDGAHVALRFVDPDGDGPGDSSLANRYVHGPVIDQVLADEQVHWDALGEDYVTDDLLWALADHLGTVRDVAELDSGSGDTSIENHLTIDSFGRITNESNDTVDHLFAFTGRENADDVDLYYYRARWFDAFTAAFIGADPIGFAGLDANLRRYASNSPVLIADPTGLWGDSVIPLHGTQLDATVASMIHYGEIISGNPAGPMRQEVLPGLSHAVISARQREPFDEVRERIYDCEQQAQMYRNAGHAFTWGEWENSSRAFALEQEAADLRSLLAFQRARIQMGGGPGSNFFADVGAGLFVFALPAEVNPTPANAETLLLIAGPLAAPAMPTQLSYGPYRNNPGGWYTPLARPHTIFPSPVVGPQFPGRHYSSNCPVITYRGERASVSPDIVFSEAGGGLRPKGMAAIDALEHTLANLGDTPWVSTSTEPAVAAGFAGPNGWLYIIRSTGGVNVNSTYGSAAHHPYQSEVAYEGGVSLTDVVGAYPMHHGAISGDYIPNPFYVHR